MRLAFLVGVCVAFAPAHLRAQAAATDQVHITCGIHYGDQKKPTDFTDIVKVTMPALPIGSSHPNTVPIIDHEFAQMTNERGIKFYKAFCVAGPDTEEVKRRVRHWEEISGYGVQNKRPIAFEEVWPALFDRLYGMHRVHRGVSRAMYSAEITGSVIGPDLPLPPPPTKRESVAVVITGTSGSGSAEAAVAAPAADEAERRRTEALNNSVDARNAALLQENVNRRRQYAEAQAEHQRKVAAAEQARRDYAEAVERSRLAAEEYERGLQAFQQNLATGGFEQTQSEALKQRAEQQRLAALKEEARLAELRRKEEDRNRLVDFKEGVVLCDRPNERTGQWRCRGPLQTTYGELDAPSGTVALGQACGSEKSIRDLGMTGGFRAFGCGFGIHPTASDYPGNIDMPAMLQVYVADRATFRCPRSKLAYCRGQ